MGEEVKKISFGFTKLSKKTTIVSSKLNVVKTEEKKVEFIDCLEGKSIKLKDPEKSEDSVLVIPLKRQENICKDENELCLNNAQLKEKYHVSEHKENPSTETNEVESVPNGKLDKLSSCTDSNVISNAPETLTLDEIAAREIIEELYKKKTEEETRIFSVPLTSNAPSGEKESSIEDYDNVPVNQFGMAMLRGMGWAPGKGIGKKEQLATPSIPTLRPKGMGLGADKVIKAAINNTPANEDLKMTKGSFVRIIAGQHKDSYGQIEGFDDESGRMVVKLVLKNVSVSINEFMAQLVDKAEFSKNSKVINVGKYERYKDDSNEKLMKLKSEKLSDNVNKGKLSPVHNYRKAVANQKPDFNDTSKSIKSDQYNQTVSRSCESELSDEEKVRSNNLSHKKSSHQSRKIRQRSSSSCSDDNNVRSRHSFSPRREASKSKSSTSSSEHLKKNPYKERSKGRSSRHSSNSSTSSNDYSRMEKSRTKKKKPSSRKHKSRSRSRSPRKHRSTHKKHKKSKY